MEIMIRSTSLQSMNRKAPESLEGRRSTQNIRSRVSTQTKQGREVGKREEEEDTVQQKHRGRRKDVLEKFLESSQPLITTSLSQLRHTILCEGLPEPCPYRSYIWSILLRAAPVESEWYSGVVARGEVSAKNAGTGPKFAHVSDKIKNDVFRTFQNNKTFWSKISESEFIRILNAFAWCVIENKEMNSVGTGRSGDARTGNISPYVQGMNVLAGPFLYVCRSEPQAFALFYKLIMTQLPRYVSPTLHGTTDGVRLVELILQTVDAKLFDSLSKSISDAKLYALPSVLTLCACTPSLEEVIKLWDFLFGFGVHMNILLVVSQLLLIRSDLMATQNPMRLLRQFPPLNSERIIKLSLSIAKSIPDDLYDLVVRHTYDDTVTPLIENYKVL